MAKKKLSKQQRQRISQKHMAYADKDMLEGLVITRGKTQAVVESYQDEREVVCNIRADIDSLVVGDKVYWQPESENKGVIEAVLPRKTALGRYDRYHHYKLLAANISQMIVVLAPKPEPSSLLLDSYLVAAECLGLKVSIVFNKTDLDDKDHELERLFRATYEDLSTHFIANSQQSPNLESFEQILKHELSVFVGQSGVGKSSIINMILPEQQLLTSPLNAIHELGQHTTSNARLYHLPSGAGIIDSPGVRAFGLGHMDKAQLLWGFKEFRPFIGRCKFRDCDHMKAPHCAILAAVANDEISRQRYENYVKLLTQFVFI